MVHDINTVVDIVQYGKNVFFQARPLLSFEYDPHHI